MKRLKDMNINSNLIAWIYDFLTDRTQYVKFQNCFSDSITTNTGSPQGCVLSPVLFTIYTNECQINLGNVKLIKFADDSCIQGLISEKSDEIEYSKSVDWFSEWCDINKLLLNTDKTKELVIDFRTKKDPIMPIVIKGSTIEQVDLYVYLGVTIDNQLSWDAQALSVISKINKRMYFLRKLGTFHIDYTIMSLFYTSVIESILTFCIIGWGGNVTIKNKTVINRSIKRAKANKKYFFRF